MDFARVKEHNPLYYHWFITNSNCELFNTASSGMYLHKFSYMYFWQSERQPSTRITADHAHKAIFTQVTLWTEVCLGFPTEATASWTI